MECEEFILPDWSPPDDPARVLVVECRLWPSGDDDEDYVMNMRIVLMRMAVKV